MLCFLSDFNFILTYGDQTTVYFPYFLHVDDKQFMLKKKSTGKECTLLWLNRLLTAKKGLPTSFVAMHDFCYQSLKKSRTEKQ